MSCQKFSIENDNCFTDNQEQRTIVNSLIADVDGCAPSRNQYFIRSTLHCTVLCCSPGRSFGSKMARVSIGLALRRAVELIATRCMTRLWRSPWRAKRSRTAIGDGEDVQVRRTLKVLKASTFSLGKVAPEEAPIKSSENWDTHSILRVGERNDC